MSVEIIKITPRQIRAARAMLGWSQDKLAKKAGLSLPAVNALEREAVISRQNTLETLKSTLEDAGIEFTMAGGVREKSEILDVKMWEGPESLKNLFQDIWAVLSGEGGILCASGIDEERFLKTDPRAIRNFVARVNESENIKVRLLVSEGDTNFIGTPEKTHYRWLPAEAFSFVPHYVYGDKYAVVLWEPPLRVLVIHNPSLAAAQRRQFAQNWARARQPPPHTVKTRIL